MPSFPGSVATKPSDLSEKALETALEDINAFKEDQAAVLLRAQSVEQLEALVVRWFRELRVRQPSLTVQNPMDFIEGELPRLIAMLRNR